MRQRRRGIEHFCDAARALTVVTAASVGGLSGCESRHGFALSPEQLTVAWQRENCPLQDLSVLFLPDGALAEVTIQEVTGTRFYIPTSWFRGYTNIADASDGAERVVRAELSGSGHFPKLYLHSPGSEDKRNCLGYVHTFRSKRTNERSDYKLTVTVKPATTESPDGSLREATQIAYSVNDGGVMPTEELWNRGFPDPLPQPFRPFATGWSRSEWSREQSPTTYFYFDESEGGRDDLNANFYGFEAIGYRFWFNVSRTATAVYDLGPRVPPERWRLYREPVRDLYRWLTTPPSQRNNDTPPIF